MEESARLVAPAAVEQVASLFGVPLTPDEHAQAARVLQVLLESMQALDAVDLDGIEPASVFDARWEA
jgi:hypothetical protein